jgi:cell division septum initiation protein DivIVA
MQVEISITIPPDRSVTKIKMDARKVLALLDILKDAVEKQNDSLLQRLNELEKELTSESDILSHLNQTISAKLASDFKKILRKNAISEQEVCKKYRVDRIEELTGGDVLDVFAEIIRSNPNNSNQ